MDVRITFFFVSVLWDPGKTNGVFSLTNAHDNICNLYRLGITCTDGELWNEQRNFATRHLREAGYGRKPMDIQIQNELNELLDYIEANRTDPIWPGSIFPASVLSVLWTFTAGKRIARNDEHLIRLLHLLNVRSKAFDMAGGILNQMPILRHVAPEKTGFNLINRFNQEIHAFFMESIKAHHCDYDEEKANDDLIYAYIREMRANEGKPTTFTDLQLSMTILDIFIAGSQTTSITLDLAMMTLATYPEIQKRIHEEMEEVLPNGQTPSPSDRGMLPYAEATLLEVQRFYHIVPISGPRRVMRETTLGGYTIPKNATVLMGLRTVHMDKEHWGDPDVFRPERFLDANKKIVNTEWLMPFGQGRRRCLGENLARSCLFTFFAGVVSRYRVVLPPGAEKPDRVLQPGITLSPKPYKVLFQNRF